MTAQKRAARVAIMRQAHKTYFAMTWRGPSDWGFPRCLRLAHASEAERKRTLATHGFVEVERAMQVLMAEEGAR